jgi:hypothetical protein
MALKKLGATAALSSSATSVLAAGANEAITIAKVLACNTDSVARTVTVYQVASGGSASASNTVLSAYSIGAGSTVTLPVSSLFLAAGAFLSAKEDSGTTVNLSINYTREDQAP